MKKLLLGLALVSGIGSVYAQNNLEGVMVDTKIVKRIRIMKNDVKNIRLLMVGSEWSCGQASISIKDSSENERTTKLDYMSIPRVCINGHMSTEQTVYSMRDISVSEGLRSVEVTYPDNLELTIQTSK